MDIKETAQRVINIENSLQDIRREVSHIETGFQGLALKQEHYETLNTQALERLEMLMNNEFKDAILKLRKCFEMQRQSDRASLEEQMKTFLKKPNFSKWRRAFFIFVGVVISYPVAEIAKLWFPIIMKKFGWL